MRAQSEQVAATAGAGDAAYLLGLIGAGRAVAKSAAKRAIDIYFFAKTATLRAFGIVDFPVPPNHNLRTTSSTSIRHYYESGLTTFLPIATAALTAGTDLDQPIRVLDFGCGVGRQLLHLTRLYPNVQAHGCDVNDDVIAYLQRAYPQVPAYANSFDPPLTYAGGTFDLVYSVSIFSHLSEKDATLWLAELKRVAKPGAVLCLTYNGLTSLARSHEKGYRLHYTAESLQANGIWFDSDERAFEASKGAESVSRFGANLLGITRLYGEIYYSAARARSLFEDAGLEVLSILPGVIDRMQDLAVVRRPCA